MTNKSEVNYCQCGLTIKEMDDILFDVERYIKELSDRYTEQEWVRILEKVQRVQMAIRSTENVCNIKFKEAKESTYGLESLLAEIHTEDSEIYRELDNCIDRLRMEK